MLRGKLSLFPLVRRRVRKFWADAHEITAQLLIHRPGCLDGDVMIDLLDLFRKFDNLREDHRFATGDDDVPTPVPPDLAQHGTVHHLKALGLPGCVRCIAPRTTEVASRSTNEDRGNAGKNALALNGIENLRNLQKLASQPNYRQQ